MYAAAPRWPCSLSLPGPRCACICPLPRLSGCSWKASYTSSLSLPGPRCPCSCPLPRLSVCSWKASRQPTATHRCLELLATCLLIAALPLSAALWSTACVSVFHRRQREHL
ncbi:hypothetical protein O6H91_01G165200 [Diphasiastrum complanatum]|uniref:Uncharacterized protein n=1 Tax=Diphasiastrum complanatum TaxID=34168 RepID=A0ACC2EY81_DIPCM|nr:hypothetical protein O6H91_Y550500 [Diphasiastrum complanatum]KAJ7571514.1 hypothetical protein O6H91_01G165200 [Diphasiastrum complanatum]